MVAKNGILHIQGFIWPEIFFGGGGGGGGEGEGGEGQGGWIAIPWI